MGIVKFSYIFQSNIFTLETPPTKKYLFKFVYNLFYMNLWPCCGT